MLRTPEVYDLILTSSSLVLTTKKLSMKRVLTKFKEILANAFVKAVVSILVTIFCVVVALSAVIVWMICLPKIIHKFLR